MSSVTRPSRQDRSFDACAQSPELPLVDCCNPLAMDPVLAKAEFFEMRADDVWQDDEKHADGGVSPGMPYMPSFDLEATMCLRRTHGVPLPSPDAELDRRSWSPNHGVDSGMEF